MTDNGTIEISVGGKLVQLTPQQIAVVSQKIQEKYGEALDLIVKLTGAMDMFFAELQKNTSSLSEAINEVGSEQSIKNDLPW